MKKSQICTLTAIFAIVFAAQSALTNDIILAIIGTAICCAMLVVGASYERKEQG